VDHQLASAPGNVNKADDRQALPGAFVETAGQAANLAARPH
jgi:hypothetical protein